jgi:hypothetical protein
MRQPQGAQSQSHFHITTKTLLPFPRVNICNNGGKQKTRKILTSYYQWQHQNPLISIHSLLPGTNGTKINIIDRYTDFSVQLQNVLDEAV